jgi:hypothetical protein
MKQRFIFIIFFLVGLLFLGVGLFFATDNFEFINEAEIATAEVIELIEKRDSDGDRSYTPVVQYFVGEKWYKYKSSISSSTSGFRVGQMVEVYYDPLNPNRAKINTLMQLWFFPGIFLLMGSIFVFLGGISTFVLIRRKRRIDHLKMNGRRIVAKVLSISENKYFKVNNKHPWIITTEARHPYRNGEVITYKSDFLWDDPREHIKVGDQLTVFVGSEHKKDYWVDTSHFGKPSEKFQESKIPKLK